MPTVYEETAGDLEDCDTVETNTKINKQAPGKISTIIQ